MWKVAAALGYCVRDADPGLGVRNRAAPGRNLQWSEGEVVRQAKRAWRASRPGVSFLRARCGLYMATSKRSAWSSTVMRTSFATDLAPDIRLTPSGTISETC